MTTIGSVVWGVRNIPRAIDFWASALDYELRNPPDGDWAVRHHLDLFTDDQAGEVERFLALGAEPVTGWDYEEDADYVVLADPDGNPFCVVQL